MATEGGHLNQERQLQSTSTKKNVKERRQHLIKDATQGQPFKQTLEEDIQRDLPNTKTLQLIFSIIESSYAGIVYADLI